VLSPVRERERENRERDTCNSLSLYLSLAGEQGAPWTNFRYRAPQVRTPSLPVRERERERDREREKEKEIGRERKR
jgi:hypothetical protein